MMELAIVSSFTRILQFTRLFYDLQEYSKLYLNIQQFNRICYNLSTFCLEISPKQKDYVSLKYIQA